jgi:hypothetical protein
MSEKDITNFLEGDDTQSFFELQAEAETTLGLLMLEKREIVPLPVDSFPKRLQALMAGNHEIYGSSFEHYGLALMTVAASCIGSSMEIKHKSCHPPIFFSALIARPGSGKSPIIKACIEPLQDIARQKINEFKAALIEYRDALKQNQEEANELDQPQPERPVVTNFTIEIIYKRLLSTAKGLMVYRDELRGWLNSMNQYKSGGDEYEFWLSAHDGLSYSVDRKNETLPLFIERVIINILGGIQPGVLNFLATKENRESGMLSRMTVAWDDTQVTLDYHDFEISPEHAEIWKRMVHFMYAIRPKLISQEGAPDREVPEIIHLSPAAKVAFAKYWNQLQQRIRDNDDEAELATITKFRSRSLRIALVLHCMEWAERMVEAGYDPGGPPDDEFRADNNYDDAINSVYQAVSGQTMVRAIALALHYENSNMRVVRQTSNPVEALPDNERAWYYSLPESGKRSLAQDLGQKAGMKSRTIDRRLKERNDIFKYGKGQYERIF